MAHRCMDCKNIIEGKSIDLAQGCPICGCKKFQYVRPKKDAKPRITVAEYVSQMASSEPAPQVEVKVPEAAPLNPEELGIDRISEPKPGHKAPKPEKKGHNDRIESVRILEKGHYDINLPVLMNRKELVMSKEDGVYLVDLPSALKPHKKKKK